MARQVLPIAGAVIGGAVGGPMGAQIGFALGSIVGNAVDPQVIKGPAIGEANLQTSAEGVFRPVVFGTAAIKGNVIVRGNRQVRTTRTSQGKGGGPVTEEQRVYWTFAIRLAEPLDSIIRIWQDEKLVYDVRPGSTIPDETAEYAQRFRFYNGADDQLPDPDLEAFQGVGNTHAYPGTSYVVFPNFDLTDRRESIPDFRFEVTSTAVLSSPTEVVDGPIYEVVGFNYPGQYLTVEGEDVYVLSDTSNVSEPMTMVVAAGENYTVTKYDDDWNVTSTDVITNPGSIIGDSRLWMVGVTADGWGISNDNNFGLCKLTFYGTTVADLRPYVDTNASWWFGESNFAPEFGGLVWFYGGNVYIGVRETGGAGVDWNSIFRWPLTNASAGVLVSTAQITNISTETNGPRFYMSVSRQGIVRTINIAEEAKQYSSDLSPIGDFEVPQEVLDKVSAVEFNGFAIDESLDLAVYIVEFDLAWVYRYSTNELLATFSLTAGDEDDIDTRVMFTSDSIFIQRRRRVYRIVLEGAADGGMVPLSYIVSQMHERANQDASYYNVSELTDMVLGVTFAGDYTAADAVRTLMPVYKFDASEYDGGFGYRINYPKRGKPVVTTLSVDQIIDAPERSVREDPLERPKKLHLHYENPTIGYAPAKATIIRSSPDIKVVGERSVQVPVAFNNVDEPAQIADRLMRVAWVEVGGEEEFTIPDNLLGLVPSDCVGVSLRGQTRRMRIVSQEIAPGRIRMRMIPDRQSAYTSNVTGVPVPEPTPPLPSIVGLTIYSPMDIPALTDNDDRLIWYDAASGQTPAWYGAQTQHKANAATEFSDSATFNQNTIMGSLLDEVSSASQHYTDTTNVVRVQLFTDDVIDSITDQQFLSEGGAFALKINGNWEILQYRDAVDEGSNVFALSHLARGRLNTEAAEHPIGSRFVLLDGGEEQVSAVTAMINTDITHRAVSFGMSPDSAVQVTEIYTAKSQTEFPVAHLFLDLVGDDLVASTVPRHRFGTEDNPVRSINWTGYRWTATDGVNSNTVDTTADSTTFDVTGWGSPITVTVSQLNRFTGPGPSVSEQV